VTILLINAKNPVRNVLINNKVKLLLVDCSSVVFAITAEEKLVGAGAGWFVVVVEAGTW
jgi:uncharacterized protein YceK